MKLHTILHGLNFFVLILMIQLPVGTMADTTPRVFGVTNGSVYQEFVTPRWYDQNTTATLSKDSGAPAPFANGAKLSATGVYELIVSSLDNETHVQFEIQTSEDTALINTNLNKTGTALEIHFQSGSYVETPVFAIWAEDIFGNFLQNLYVSAMPATNIMRFTNNYVLRPQSVPFWAHKSCVEKVVSNGDCLYLSEPEIPIPSDLDAVSGATQKGAFILRSKTRTNEINDSRINIFFEINQSFDSGWYFYGANNTHEEDENGMFSNDKYFTGSEEPAIVYSVEIDLNKTQTYVIGGTQGQIQVQPIGYSHYGGRTAELYTDFYADDNGSQRYKFDHAPAMVELLTVTPIPGPQELYTGDFDRDQDVDSLDLAKITCRSNLISPYLAEFASNFGTTGNSL